jgi:glutaredoxin
LIIDKAIEEENQKCIEEAKGKKQVPKVISVPVKY